MAHAIFALSSTLPPVRAFSRNNGVCRAKDEIHQRDRRHPRRSGYTKKCPSRGVITIRRSDGKWVDSWTDEHVTSLEAFGLMDLASPTVERNNDVAVALSVQKHAAVGYSVDGRVVSSVTRQCIHCSRKFTTKINASFSAWCIPRDCSFSHFEEAGRVDDDPSIIYFSPGKEEANLHDFVRDTIRVNCSTGATCSDACEKSGSSKWEFGDAKVTVSSIWLPILKANVN